jgi:hypothetical protein
VLHITKILANRMVHCLRDLFSLDQSTFIPNQSIAKNVLLAHETVRNYHRSEGKPRCTFKVDLMKAYDSIVWVFIM